MSCLSLGIATTTNINDPSPSPVQVDRSSYSRTCSGVVVSLREGPPDATTRCTTCRNGYSNVMSNRV